MTDTAAALPAAAVALPPDRRPAPPGRLATTAVFATRAALKLRHVPEQLADAVLLPVIFTVLFTYVFGGALAGSPGRYLHTLLPGTLVMTVLIVTVYTGLTLRTDVDSGVLDRFRSLPLWRPGILLGGMLGDLVRYVVAGGLVIVLGVALGFRPPGGAGGMLAALAVVLVFAVALSWVWTALALLVRTAASVTTLGFVVQFPLLFASNVFVDPRTMPGWLRGFVDVNPVSHLVSTVRALVDGTATATGVAEALGAAAALAAVFAALTTYLYRTRV